jgi:uncharacterized protein (TIGR02996 family)
MTDEEAAFRRAVVADLADPEPQRVYADWLDEQGRHDEAALMRAGAFAALAGFTDRVSIAAQQAVRAVAPLFQSATELLSHAIAAAEAGAAATLLDGEDRP